MKLSETNKPAKLFNHKSAIRNHKFRGFTLIELLVVVAIIAVLIAMLLPALHTAREQAKTVVCQSQLRQLGIEFQFYADAYQDYVASYALSKNSTPRLQWNDCLASQGPGFNVWEKTTHKITLCPSNPVSITDPTTGLPLVNYGQIQTVSWPFRYMAWQNTGNDGNAWIGPPYRFSDSPTPASKVLLTDLADNKDYGREYGVLVVSYFSGDLTWQYQVSRCHNDGTNALYFDGHASHTPWVLFVNNIWQFFPDKE